MNHRVFLMACSIYVSVSQTDVVLGTPEVCRNSEGNVGSFPGIL